MKEVYVKYNPFRLETEVKIDGQEPAQDSDLNVGDKRLQEWVEDLPGILRNEYKSKEFSVEFHGTTEDFDDVAYVLKNTGEELKFSLKHTPAKEVVGREKLIDNVFREIQKGPIEELKSEKLKDSFDTAKSNDFKVTVVAAMKAGKSTLINALLEQELMPNATEAKTAIITYLKDSNDPAFKAVAYDKDGKEFERRNGLDYEKMDSWNKEEKIVKVVAEGRLPFVDPNEETKLVIIDTPGPNNARTKEHRIKQQDELNTTSLPLVLYIMNVTSIHTDDDVATLNYVAQEIKSSKKRSRDRFLFVVNKLDEYDTDKGDMNSMIEEIRARLKEDYEIEDPNIFPVSAKAALLIKKKLTGKELTGKQKPDHMYMVECMNTNDKLHLEKYAPLPPSLKNEIKCELEEARNEKATSDNNADNTSANKEAFIHSGVRSLELAIQQYVRKYAKTAKIKNLVDTFYKQLESAESEEKLHKELASLTENRDKVAAELKKVREKLKDAKEAASFEEVLNNTVEAAKYKFNQDIKSLRNQFQAKIRDGLDSVKSKGPMIPEEDAKKLEMNLTGFAKSVLDDFRSSLYSAINKGLIESGKMLIAEYRVKINKLTKDISLGNMGINFAPLRLVEGKITGINVEEIAKEQFETVSRDRPWDSLDKWTLGIARLFRDNQVSVQQSMGKFVDVDVLSSKFMATIDKKIGEDIKITELHANDVMKSIVGQFRKEFNEINAYVENKLHEAEKIAVDKENAEKNLAEAKKRLDWLAGIMKKADEILEI